MFTSVRIELNSYTSVPCTLYIYILYIYIIYIYIFKHLFPSLATNKKQSDIETLVSSFQKTRMPRGRLFVIMKNWYLNTQRCSKVLCMSLHHGSKIKDCFRGYIFEDIIYKASAILPRHPCVRRVSWFIGLILPHVKQNGNYCVPLVSSSGF